MNVNNQARKVHKSCEKIWLPTNFTTLHTKILFGIRRKSLMRVYIVIPTYNEEAYLEQTLQSLVEQTITPNKIVIVNDNSTDNSQIIIDDFSSKYNYISSVTNISAAIHEPGSKVINAFNKGLEELDDNFDVVCKFDADLIFPKQYVQSIISIFKINPACGMAGGFCYILDKNDWKLENPRSIKSLQKGMF